MTQTELILEYIDGGLDLDAEQGLFDAMARHPELRSALRQFIVIGDAVRADREAYTPPAHVERALMAGLDIGASYAPAATVAAGGLGLLGRLSAFGGRFLSVIAAFLLGALLAGGIMLMTDRGDEAGTIAGRSAQNRGAGDGTIADARRNTESRDPASGAVPQMGGSAENRNAASSSGSQSVTDGRGADGTGSGRDGGQAPALRSTTSSSTDRTITNSNAARNSSGQSSRSNRSGVDRLGNTRSGNNGSASNDGNGNDGSRISSSALSSNEGKVMEKDDASARAQSASNSTNTIPDVLPVAPRTEASSRETMRGVPVELTPESLPENFPAPVEFQFEDTEQKDAVLAMELRHNFVGGPFNSNKARRSTPAFDNSMFSVIANPRDVFSFGVEGGRESFDQTLHYSDDDTLQVEQRPSFMWLGATGRLRMGGLPFAGADAFVQGTIAGSAGGPIMRMRVAGEIPVFSHLNAMVGLETSALVYTFRDELSITGRWGITTGLMWNF